MTVTLEPPVFRHGLAVSAIARVSLWPMQVAGGVAMAGSKQPVAVVVHDGTMLRGFDLAGRALSAAEVEALFPGASDALATAWQARHARKDCAPPAAFSGNGG